MVLETLEGLGPLLGGWGNTVITVNDNGDGVMVTLAGLAVGGVGALVTVRLVETLLFGVTPQDPVTLAARDTRPHWDTRSARSTHRSRSMTC